MSLAFQTEEYTGICVAPQFIKLLFPQIKHHLAAARVASGFEFYEDAMLQDLLNKDVLLWLALRHGEIVGVVTTRLQKGDGGAICMITGLGGRGMPKWLHLIELIEQYAVDEGCARMRIEGRRGWQRALSDYHQTGVILEKRL